VGLLALAALFDMAILEFRNDQSRMWDEWRCSYHVLVLCGERRNVSRASNERRWIPGLVLIVIGVLALVGQFVQTDLWGILILPVMGIGFLVWGLVTRRAGLLIPGGILSGLGLGVVLTEGPLLHVAGEDAQGAIIMLCFAAGWALITLLSVLFTEQKMWWPLIPGAIMAFVGVALLAGSAGLQALELLGKVWPVFLIAFGLYLLLMRSRARS
jgi:CDP-diglyceride synthetase